MHHLENSVYDMKSAGISATFYADKFIRESYFEMWQKSALCQHLKHLIQTIMNNYVSNLNIFQLGQFARQERDDVTYGVQLIDCFPVSIGAIEYSHDANNVQTIDVDFHLDTGLITL